jgi:hypothetical protein
MGGYVQAPFLMFVGNEDITEENETKFVKRPCS